MQLKRVIGSVTAVVALTAAGILYAVHPAKSSDHQDTYNLATSANGHNTSADITDVYVFPAPDNANNVVFAMDTSPLIAPGAGTSHFFDPTLIYQFKISHSASGVEDEVIQVGVTGTGATQTFTLYGPNKVNEASTTNTLVASTGTFNFNAPATLTGGIQAFAGPKTDPFFFDLFAFFTFAGDRNYGTHPGGQSDPGPETASNPEGLSNGDTAANLSGLAPSYDQTGNTPGPNAPTMPSFNGFASGTMSNTNLSGNGVTYNPPLGPYACSTNPASDTLYAGPFNVEAIVIEVPKSLLTTASLNTAASTSSTIHVWATTNSSTGS